MRRGCQKRYPQSTAPRQGGVLAGVINWRSAVVHCQSFAQWNAESLIIFLEGLFETVYPTQKLLIVLDNSSVHHAASVQALVSLYPDRVLLYWLPTYSPDLNLIERFWKHLKQRVWCNQLYASLTAVWEAVHAEVAQQNQPDNVFRLSFSKNL